MYMAERQDFAEADEPGSEDWLLSRLGSLGALDASDRLAWIDSVASILSAERAHLTASRAEGPAYIEVVIGAQISVIDAQLHWLGLLATREREALKARDPSGC